MSTAENRCPYCDSILSQAYFIIGGGVWCCEDKDYMEHHVAGDAIETYGVRNGNNVTVRPPKPLHCLIGGSGWHGGHGTWPKEGLFCQNCLAFVVKAR